MSQTNAIILRIRAEDADEFERAFREHEYPIWEDFKGRGRFLAASLTRVEYGTHQTEGIVNFLVMAKLTGHSAHSEHDNDPRFQAWDAQAERFQVEEPLVFGGSTVFEI